MSDGTTPNQSPEELVAALRQLRPDVQPPPLPGWRQQRMLAALVAADPSTDPATALLPDHGEDAALLVLVLALDHLTLVSRAIASARDAAAEGAARLRARYEGSFGALPAAVPPDLPDWFEVLDRISASAELVDGMRRMRAFSGLSAASAVDASLEDPSLPALAAGLLRLPDHLDPLAWLRNERGPLCGELALSHVAQSLTGLVLGDERSQAIVQHSDVATAVWQAPAGLETLVQGFNRTADGFAIDLVARFAPLRPHARGITSWDGIERVRSEGYRYVFQHRRWNAQRGDDWCKQSMTVQCWPALPGDQVTLSSDHSTIAHWRPEHGRSSGSHDLGALELTIRVPGRPDAVAPDQCDRRVARYAPPANATVIPARIAAIAGYPAASLCAPMPALPTSAGAGSDVSRGATA